LGPGSSAINLNDSTISVFTDSGDSQEFDGVNQGNGLLIEGDTVLSTDSSDDGATATLHFDLSVASMGTSVGSNSAFESGTTVDIVITTAEGTQAETSFIIEDPLDPQLQEDNEIRLG
jgi:flagellin FlaB